MPVALRGVNDDCDGSTGDIDMKCDSVKTDVCIQAHKKR